MEQNLISRKEIAQITELSVDVVRKNEAALGLSRCKVVINGRLIRYRRRAVFSALTELGLIAVTSQTATTR